MRITPRWILCIEDNEDDLCLVRETLPLVEYIVLWAPSGGVARQRLTSIKFDLVLLDHGLPDTNGLLVLDEIRASHPGLPVILLTGREDQALAVSAVKKGAARYLLKEEMGRLLRSAVDEALAAAAHPAPPLDFQRQADRLSEVLLSLMNEGCLLVDVDGVVTYANEAAGRMLGTPAAQVPGHRAAALFSEATRTRLQEFQAAQGQPEAPRTARFEGRLGRDDRPVILSVRGLGDELGKFEASLLVLTDITELVEARNALRARLAELERFQRFFVDRERHVVELKGKLREYERRLGLESGGLSEETKKELERRLAARPVRP